MVRARKNPPDGRANNGGARQGQPGQRYPNRSDLRAQKVSVPPSAEYGQGERLRAAQQAVPMAGAPTVLQPAGSPGQPPPRWATPDDTPTLTAPTQRPDEPLEAGLPFGPGPGPEVLGPAPMNDVEARLRALYSAYPTTELRELLAQMDQA